MIELHTLSGGTLEVLDLPARDAGLPELLLLHEGLGSVSMWRDFPAELAAATGCRTVAYSRLGFGRSAPRTRAFSPRFMHEEALETLPELRAKLGIANPVLVGHSTGASMALVHAGAGVGQVAGVVAMAPLVTLEPSNLASIREAGRLYATTGWRARLARHHDDVDAVFRGWNETWLDPAFSSWNLLADLTGISAPILAILGEDDPYSTPTQLEVIATHARNASGVELLKLPDCGHAPHRERPTIVLAAIARFARSQTGNREEGRFER